MYISLFTLLFILGIIYYFAWRGEKESDLILSILNTVLAVSYIEKEMGISYIPKQFVHRYAFLLQYLLDMNNLKVADLNRKWLSIYSFFKSRTQGFGIPITYMKYGRVHPDVIITISEMYKSNSYGIGQDLWKQAAFCFEDLSLGDNNATYPKSIEALIASIVAYDRAFTGHIMMAKRS